MKTPKIGLLPLYVELYDHSSPECRPVVEANYAHACEKLRSVGLEVLTAPVCRLESEFEAAISSFEVAEADAIVTLHLAYSPSLESQQPLANTKLPLIILDTTPAYTYDQHTDAGELMFNHGIHGVMDMCNLLRRNGKPYVICAGHMDHSDVLDQVCKAARAACVVSSLRRARVGLVGEPFQGMGDFRLPTGEFSRDLGITIVPYDFQASAQRIAAVTQADLDAEYEKDCVRFQVSPDLKRTIYDETAKVCLAVRRWCQEEKLSAFTINFLATGADNSGLPRMPFTECCTAMENGTGYAGEGDVLTAALIGALLSVYPQTTFSEMFCPDWEHNTVFLSHMGEFNYRIAQQKPRLAEKPFPFTSAENPTVAYATMQGGAAVFLNLAPLGNGRYVLTLTDGEMMQIRGENTMSEAVNGWFRPNVPLPEFFRRYSEAGATHHSAVIYGASVEELLPIAKFLSCDVVVI